MKSTYPIALSSFIVNYTTNPFNFKIIRRSDNELLFDSSVGNIIFSEHYIEISTKVASRYAWGFGERFSNRFRVQPGKYTIFNRDRGQVIDKQQGLQTYGHYPIYLLRDNSSNFHINYFRNSNAMDIIVNESSGDTYTFTYKTIGGMIDFRFILGTNSAEEAIERFHLFLGRAAVPPFWSLGFHQCRWGYENISYLENVTSSYEQNNIPLDTIWSDIDYMVDYEDFTIDESRFNLTRMTNLLKNYHYIPIIDAGIKVNNGTAYTQGVKRGVFLKDGAGN
jgi:alpha-glucosidase (family GH31 glycosyl hydrolase)